MQNRSDINMRCIGLLLASVYLLPLICVPFASAVALAPDEPFALIKGAMYLKGSEIFRTMWNDQPVLYTSILAKAFEVFGPTALVGRITGLLFGGMLLLLIVMYCDSHIKWCGSLIGGLLFLLSPGILRQCYSATVEIPAMACGLLSVIILRSKKGISLQRLIVSSFVMGAALNVKASAGIFIPMALAEIIMRASGPWSCDPSREIPGRAEGVNFQWAGSINVLRPFLLAANWLILSSAVGCTILTVLPHYSPQTIVETHLGAFSGHLFDNPEAFRFSFSLVMSHTEGMLTYFAIVAILLTSRFWHGMLPPFVLLATVTAIHMHHRPWWDYYYAHFAVAIALGGGVCVNTMADNLSRWKPRRPGVYDLKMLVFLAGILCIGVTTMYTGGKRYRDSISLLKASPTIYDYPVFKAVSRYLEDIETMYTSDIAIPFHLRKAVHPHLAILSAKRFWTGQLTERQLFSEVKKWAPDALILTSNAEKTEYWDVWVLQNYSLVYDGPVHQVFISRSRLKQDSGA